MKDLRRLVSTVVIVSFSIAALMGIAALLGGGDFDETQLRVLGTTVIVGCESIAVLCYLALAGHRWVVVGAAGGLVSLVASGTALALTWSEAAVDSEPLWRAFGIAVTVAVSLAQASLLIALAGRRRVGPGLVATLAVITVLAAMVIVPILDAEGLGDGYWRALGVVAILDVLGTVVVTALGVLRRRQGGPSDRELSPEVWERLLRQAQERGTTPSQLLSDALDALVVDRRG
jgi:hypothetical protein